jgi:protein SCO1/2
VPLRAEEAPAAVESPGKSCCHKPPSDDAALPAGLTDQAEAAPATTDLPPPVSVSLVEATLRDRSGASVRFPADVVGDRIVVVDFIFTSCTTICPILSARLARVQERLGDRLGREVRLVSLSIDPVRDTPDRLAGFGARFGAGPGWSWLTGDTDEVTRVLKGLGAWTPQFTEHAPAVLVGDGRTGRWYRFNGFPPVDRLVGAVDALAATRLANGSATTASLAGGR